jgi:hypothetical protein
MSNDYTAQLREVASGLHGEAGQIEHVGRTLTPGETRRAHSLRAAADLVQQAIDELASGTAAPASDFDEAPASLDEPEATAPINYREGGMGSAGSRPDQGGMRDSSLFGSDDTPNYGSGDDEPGYRGSRGGIAGG